MSDQEKNLRVLTEHIDALAAKQASVAGTLKIAGETVNDLSSKVEKTHGVVCLASNMAVTALESARDDARARLWQISHDLDERLKTASVNYNNADWLSKEDLGDECRT